MDELVKKVLLQAAALKKQPDSVPWTADEPWPQSYHLYSAQDTTWAPVTPSADDGGTEPGITALALYTWNIDMMLPFAKERIDAALAHLEELVEPHLGPASTTAIVINLQECVPEDLATISKKQWVRDNFYLTDVDHAAWASAAYGTTMLIDRRLKITSTFRVHYTQTRMERDALFVDVAVPSRPAETLRLCNTHLESLALEPPFRPLQMQAIAKYVHADGVTGAIVAGDLNAIQPSDVSLHADNKLKDAYLELGGEQTGDKGFTWGQQVLPSLRQQFGFSRMDKVLFRGDVLRLQGLSKFGMDIMVDGEAARQLLALGFEKPWVTDHLGLNAVFNIVNDSRL